MTNFVSFIKGLEKELKKEFPDGGIEYDITGKGLPIHISLIWFYQIGGNDFTVFCDMRSNRISLFFKKDVLDSFDLDGNMYFSLPPGEYIKERYIKKYDKLRDTVLAYLKPTSVQFILGCSL